jgi:hypothetical protein
VGTRGPIPKRVDERLGHETKAELAAVTKAPAARKVPVPAADPEWHPVALRWYRSLKRSGQARFYEPSDWSAAYLVAESMSRDLGEQFLGFRGTGEGTQVAHHGTVPLKGANLGAYLKAFAVLGVTEGDRRRMQIELQRQQPAEQDGTVVQLDDWRDNYG